ncbi:MAG: SMP-30/gluconolactonase/LRE family protein [Actinomycetota bacterium]
MSTAPTLAADLLFDAGAVLGEGPVWDARLGALVWVDIERHLVHVTSPNGADRTFDAGQRVGVAVPRAGGGLVLAVQDGFSTLDLETGAVESVAAVEAELDRNRMNDGKCDPVGRFWAGTMSIDDLPQRGALYRLDTDRSVTSVVEGVTISNGLAWSADSRTMYFIDTPTQRVDAFDFDPAGGSVSNRRTVVEIAPEDGSPDGMTIDADDRLWVALWGGAAVRRYEPDGRLDAMVELPTSLVTSCAFGGDDFEDLFITSASIELSHQERRDQPFAGGVFRCRPGARGIPPHAYGG